MVLQFYNRKQSISDQPLGCAEESDCLATHTGGEVVDLWRGG